MPSSPKIPPVVAIVGTSNSGKTTLIEGLIPALVRRGVKVGTIKHHHHAGDFEPEGKDTWRHRRAGAAKSCLASPTQLVAVTDLHEEPDPGELARREFEGFDLVLVEGGKHGPFPKIEVIRTGRGGGPLALQGGERIAIVTDGAVDADVALFRTADAEGLAAFLIERFCGDRG